jgi:hypothetical protein
MHVASAEIATVKRSEPITNAKSLRAIVLPVYTLWSGNLMFVLLSIMNATSLAVDFDWQHGSACFQITWD